MTKIIIDIETMYFVSRTQELTLVSVFINLFLTSNFDTGKTFINIIFYVYNFTTDL